VRIAVIGAGVIGVTTAYELGADGHEVTVFERHGTVGAESSFAHAGLVGPGCVSPWTPPGGPRKVLSNLFRDRAPVRVDPTVAASSLGWLWRWWRASQAPACHVNRARLVRLAHFSRERLDALTNHLHLEFEGGRGLLVLLRSPRELALVRPAVQALSQLGVATEVIDGAACRAIEPGLSPHTALHAGIHSPDDRVGNCRQFTHLLRKEAGRAGVQFRFGLSVERIIPGRQPRLLARRTPIDPRERAALRAEGAVDWKDTEPPAGEDGEQAFDAIVVCNALGAGTLMRPLGLRLPLLAVHGCSVTAPLRHDDQHLNLEPRAAVMDERYQVVISRLGHRVRVAGSMDIGGRAERPWPAAQATLDKVLDDWFPGIVNSNQAQRWRGARPTLPDGPPVLGPSGCDGIWLNVGHGSSGWALACGSARLVADAIAGRPTPIGIDGLGVERLRR